MTLREIIYDILGILYGGNPEDDISISEEQVKSWIDQNRAVLLRQLSNQGKPMPLSTGLVFCFEMELVDASICCGWDAGCTILRSKEQLPPTIPHGSNIDGVLMVASVSGGKQFGRTTVYRARWDRKSPYAEKNPFFFVKDNYLYINSKNPLIKVVEVTLLPEDPIAAMELNACKDGSAHCDDKWDAQYPMPAHMVDMLVNKIVKERGGVTRQIPEDQLNDGRETT